MDSPGGGEALKLGQRGGGRRRREELAGGEGDLVEEELAAREELAPLSLSIESIRSGMDPLSLPSISPLNRPPISLKSRQFLFCRSLAVFSRSSSLGVGSREKASQSTLRTLT